MIPVKRVDHISMAARSVADQRALLERLLGFEFDHGFEAGPAEPYSGAVLGIPGTSIGFEILEPVGESSFVERFLQTRGAGIHHVTIEVHSIEQAMASLEQEGIEAFGGLQVDRDGWRQTFIHPRDGGGLLWQIFEPQKPEKPVRRPTDGGVVGLVRLDHLSMATPDLDAQIDWLKRVFGMEVLIRFANEAQGFEACTMGFPGSDIVLELMAPTSDAGFVARFLAERGPGPHHICAEVRSVEAAVAGLRGAGIEAFGGVIDPPEWKRHTFIHPRDAGGVLFQLFEERGQVR